VLSNLSWRDLFYSFSSVLRRAVQKPAERTTENPLVPALFDKARIDRRGQSWAFPGSAEKKRGTSESRRATAMEDGDKLADAAAPAGKSATDGNNTAREITPSVSRALRRFTWTCVWPSWLSMSTDFRRGPRSSKLRVDFLTTSKRSDCSTVEGYNAKKLRRTRSCGRPE